MEKTTPNQTNGSPNGNNNKEGAVVSYVELDGEWRFRKISLMSLVSSFISQLQIGQDLTRVSLPAVMLHPFSMLEVIAFRELGYFDHLLPVNEEEDPLARFLLLVRWYLSTIQQETFHKKPYNPVLGETHLCTVQTKDYGTSRFISEQVSHHPPISAFYVQNAKADISIWSNIGFTVKFGGNHVSITCTGIVNINVGKHKETYESSRFVPNMVIRNVVWGTKKIFWEGPVTLSGPNGYRANILFEEKSGQNVVSATVLKDSVPLKKIQGACGGLIKITDVATNKTSTFVDVAALQRASIIYEKKSESDPLASMTVWEKVNEYIILDKMPEADSEKKRIEDDQRARVKKREEMGTDHAAKYFVGTEKGWMFKEAEAEEDMEECKDEESDEKGEEEEDKTEVIPVTTSPEIPSTVHGQMKMKNTLAIWVTRYFTLERGRLAFYKNKRDKKHLNGIISLVGCSLTPRRNTLIKIDGIVPIFFNPEEGMEGTHIPSSPHFLLKMSSASLRARWLHALQAHIEYANSHKDEKPEDPKQFESPRIRSTKSGEQIQDGNQFLVPPLSRTLRQSPKISRQHSPSTSPVITTGLLDKPNKLKEGPSDEYIQALEDVSQQVLRRLIHIERMNTKFLQQKTIKSILFQNFSIRELLFAFLLGFLLSRFIIS